MRLIVKVQFRDASNFTVRHEVGDEIEVTDQERIARLLDGGLCEPVRGNHVKETNVHSNEVTAEAADITETDKPAPAKKASRAKKRDSQ